MQDVLLHCITTFLLNKRSLAKIISEKVVFCFVLFWFFLLDSVHVSVYWFAYWSRGREIVIDKYKYCLITVGDMAS